MTLLNSGLEMETLNERRASNGEGTMDPTLQYDMYEEDMQAAATAREGEKEGYKNFVRKSIANGILIALWY